MNRFVLTLATVCFLAGLSSWASAAEPARGKIVQNRQANGVNRNYAQNFGVGRGGIPIYNFPYGNYGYGNYGYGGYGGYNQYYRNSIFGDRYYYSGPVYGNPYNSFVPASAFGFGPGAIFGW
jgi:hypothetical protein